MTGPHTPQPDAVPALHYPQEGDGVARWLAAQRDLHPAGTVGWLYAETLLTEYRLHALHGTPLPEQPFPEPGEPAPTSRPRLTLLPPASPTEEEN